MEVVIWFVVVGERVFGAVLFFLVFWRIEVCGIGLGYFLVVRVLMFFEYFYFGWFFRVVL